MIRLSEIILVNSGARHECLVTIFLFNLIGEDLDISISKKEIRVIITEEKKLNCPYLKTSNCLQRKPRRRANLVELRRLQKGYKRNISGVPRSNQLQNGSQTSNEN